MKVFIPIILTAIFTALVVIAYLIFSDMKVNKELFETLKKETTQSTEMQLENVRNEDNHINEISSVAGKICYLTESIPPLEVNLKNIDSEEITNLFTKLNDTSYSFDNVAPGSYIAYAYVKDIRDSIGGYTKYLACQEESEECSSHELKIFEVEKGQNVTGIDICDWAAIEPGQDSGLSEDEDSLMNSGIPFEGMLPL